MQFIKRVWSKGRKGKAAIGCGGLLFLCSICTVVSMIWSATPQGRQAAERRNATATASALIKAETANAPTATARPTKTPVPTNTPHPSNTSHPTATARIETPGTAGVNATTTLAPTTTPVMSTSVPTTSLPPAPVARSNANLRSGPGVNYPIVGSVPAGTPLDISARTAAGDWLLLATGVWISADLVTNAPTVPVAEIIPTPPATSVSSVAPIVVATAAPGGGNSNPFTCIGGCATPPDPSCAIKGNVNSKGEKIYHMPGQRDYERTDIKPEEGDRWFCTEEEARAAGFRHAKR